MLLALLFAATPVAEAERAFAAAAERDGQWTAFRTYAAHDAVMFAPEMVQVGAFLAGRKDPPESLRWRPARTISACDGRLAYSTGTWTGPGGAAHGAFGTIWRHDRGGWAWIYDGGHDGPAPQGGQSLVAETASCDGAPAAAQPPSDAEPLALAALVADAGPDLTVASDGAMPSTVRLGAVLVSGASGDRSLLWRINAVPEGDKGAHLLRVWSWTGRGYRLAVLDLTGKAPSIPTTAPK
jgi:hypothetical protein